MRREITMAILAGIAGISAVTGDSAQADQIVLAREPSVYAGLKMTERKRQGAKRPDKSGEAQPQPDDALKLFLSTLPETHEAMLDREQRFGEMSAKRSKKRNRRKDKR
jgi:hypothetical protein